MGNPQMFSCKAAALSSHLNKSVKDWRLYKAMARGCWFYKVILAMFTRLFGTLADDY